MKGWLSICLALWLPVRVGAEEPKPRFAQRWFYAPFNLLADKNTDTLVDLIGRAGKSGYNGVVLADYKLNILGRMPKSYFHNVERVKKAAEAAGIEIIPAIFPIGYSDGLLAHDPNLAEGLPVKDAPFVVRGRQAVLSPEKPARVINGSLEEVKGKGDVFAGFSFQDDPGVTTFADREVVHGGHLSCRMQDVGKHNKNGVSRLSQRVAVRPWACYRLSAWVKTRQLENTRAFHLVAIGANDGRSLTFHETRLERTGDWKQVSVVFNSLGEKEVNLYAGQWGATGGTLWLDDLELEELSLVNVLRRPGCPLLVTAEDGKTVYDEGQDFLPVRDVKLGVVPYAGLYDFNHLGPKIELTAASHIKDGERLRVSWYHPVHIHGEQMMCCLSEPKLLALLRDQLRRVNDLFHPTTVFFWHDEVRVVNWCKACQATHTTPGELLAANVRHCADLLKEVNPHVRIVIWSDMFDPHHNAVGRYYLVNGPLTGSWKGLPADAIIANWNLGKAQASLKWFADRGHAQILAGYYDGGLDNLRKWQTAAQGIPRARGFLYTTWEGNYSLLEAYGKALLGKD
jgi:hypothetical protein